MLSDLVQYDLPLTDIGAYSGYIRATTLASLAAAAARVDPDRAYVAMFVDALRVVHPDLAVIPATDLDLKARRWGGSQAAAGMANTTTMRASRTAKANRVARARWPARHAESAACSDCRA